MTNNQYDVNDLNLSDILLLRLNHVNSSAAAWVAEKRVLLKQTGSVKDFYVSFALTPRFTSREVFKLEEERISQINKLYDKDLKFSSWNIEQVCRLILMLSFPANEKQTYKKVISDLFKTAEVNELVTILKSLPFLPFPDAFQEEASEGVRSNMGVVFDSICLENSYPFFYFNLQAWNQMVLKAVFTGKDLRRIIGLDERRNPELARMCVDLAHERWAAGRDMPASVWRLTAPYFADINLKSDLERLFSSSNRDEQYAAALACRESRVPSALQMLETYPELKQKVEKGEISWAILN